MKKPHSSNILDQVNTSPSLTGDLSVVKTESLDACGRRRCCLDLLSGKLAAVKIDANAERSRLSWKFRAIRVIRAVRVC